MLNKKERKILKGTFKEAGDAIKSSPGKYAKSIKKKAKKNYNYGKQGAKYAAKKVAGLDTDKAIKNRLNKAYKKWKANH